MLPLRSILKSRLSPWLLRPSPTVMRLYAAKAGKTGKVEEKTAKTKTKGNEKTKEDTKERTEKTEKEKTKDKTETSKDKTNKTKENGKKKNKDKPSPLDRFFTSFASFAYDPKKPITKSLKALQMHLKYKSKSPEWEEVLQKYKHTLPEEVKTWFAGSDRDIHAWHRLYRALGKTPAKTSFACAMKIRGTYVNIVDLIEWGRSGEENGPVSLFSSVKELADYCHETGKYFPKDEVTNDKGETNIVLRQLLHKVR